MTIKKGHILELDVTDMAFGGKGVSKVDGFTIFVDHAAPGDRVEARIVRKKKRWAEARITQLLTPSSHRVKAPCMYSGYCGGCKWQFLDYDAQLRFKRQFVADSLAHIALIHDVPVHPVIGSDKILGYRNKMEFSCSDRRWLLPEEMGDERPPDEFAIGLHVPGTFSKVLDTKACLLQPDQGNAILEDVRQYIKGSGVPVYGLRSHEGFWRFLMLRHSAAHDQWMVNIITSSEDRDIVTPLARQLTERYPNVASLVNNITSRKAGVAIGEYEILLAGSPTISDRIGRFEFNISANSFFQTNTAGAAKLYETVRRFAGLTGRETVFDLYSGAGTIAIWLSSEAGQVIGMEIVPSASADAEANRRRNNITNCRFMQGDIGDCLDGADATPDVMIIDPPRAGMHKDVVAKILNIAPEKIVYVSCNPATMARDLGMMKEQYAVAEVQPVDMFPHTFHIESVARLVKTP